jgi:hypothetical protein
MILFTNDTAEDMRYMRAGIENVTITPETVAGGAGADSRPQGQLGLTEDYIVPITRT